MRPGITRPIPIESLSGGRSEDSSALLDLLLTWGRSCCSVADLTALLPLMTGLPNALSCAFAGLWTYRSEGCFERLYPRLPTVSGTERLRIQPPPRHPLVWNSPAAFATEMPPLSPFLPEGMTHALIYPIIAGEHYLGLLCLADDQRVFDKEDLKIVSGMGGLVAQMLQAHALQEFHRRAEERRKLLDHIRGHLQRTLNLELLISRILDEVNTAIHAEAQSIWLVDESASLIRCRFATGPGAEAIKQIAVPLGEGIVGNTVARQEAYLIADAQSDVRHSRRADRKTGITTHSLVSVPLVRDGRTIGAIQAINKRDEASFTTEDLDLLQSIADIAALAIENARLYAELENSYDTTLQALTAALDARDHETEGHSRRVVEYAVRLAREIGLSGAELRTLRRGALIHDIGKIGIPDAILHKPGPLTPEETEVMRRHPELGYEMLRGVSHLSEEVMLVLAHQERWDGRGYPAGLSGNEIPLFARLFAIVDTFDAILSDRPYRKGRPYSVACRIIEEEAGKQFDPSLVNAFLAIPEEEWNAIRHGCERKPTG
ncbi:MAG: GAF domain-containing protein [Capsulimonadales bacterium]|nr:GAF domain-containing protein [Capsulimonadales bacterium]